MKALVIEHNGEPSEVVHWRDLPEPTPGSEGVGIIDAVGSDVPRTRIGERVVLLDVPGTWREQVISPAARAIPVPAAISDEDAAQALINPMTAWAMTMFER